MKKLFIFLLLTAPIPAQANGISHKIINSIQLDAVPSLTNSTRGANSYSLSTSGVTASNLGGFAFGDNSAGLATYTAPSLSQTTAGAATSVTQSVTLGDAYIPISSGATVSSGVIGSLPAFSNVVSQSGGVAGSLAGTVSATTAAITHAPGPGSTGIASISSEVKIGDW